jgi:hypothetical protein
VTVNSVRYICGIPLGSHIYNTEPVFWNEKGNRDNACVHAKYLYTHRTDHGQIFIGRARTAAEVFSPSLIYGEDGNMWYKGGVVVGDPGDTITRGFCYYASGSFGGNPSGNPITGWRVGNAEVRIHAYCGENTKEYWWSEYYGQQMLYMRLFLVGAQGAPGYQPGDIYSDQPLGPTPAGTVLGHSPVSGPDLHALIRQIYGILRSVSERWEPVYYAKAKTQKISEKLRSSWSPTKTLLPSALTPADFMFSEYETVSLGWEINQRRDYHGYYLERMKQHAFVEAVESVPTMSDNSISNILEIVETLHGLVHGEVKIPKRLQEAWLAYRYQYMTTKLDVQEAILFFKRYADLKTLNRSVKAYGESSTIVDGIPCTCRCRLEIKPKVTLDFDDLWGKLSQLGLAPDAYVAWDMTPFSFMVDWFVPVGDVLDVLDQAVLVKDYWNISSICYSLSYNRELNGYKAKFYTRWHSDVPPSLSGYYWLGNDHTSTKVLLYRILDTASLFIGGQ